MSIDSKSDMKHVEQPASSKAVGDHLRADDPDNPMSWPFSRRIFVSLSAWLYTASVTFGLTSYTVAIPEIMEDFNLTMPIAILGFSIYMFGIFFAPIYTPHCSERFGRRPLYYISLFLCMLFTLGASRSMTWTSLVVCRFFAGFTGGPCLILIEGTFADIWSATTTNTYYSFLAASANAGAGLAPIILGFIIPTTSWRWTQYISLIFMFAAFLFGIGMPETYPREIIRAQAKKAGKPHDLSKAESGVTLPEMAKVTIIDPLIMLVSEPIVIISSLLLGANFGFLFQWFITVPVALESTYNFTIQRVGLAFIAAYGGTALALVTAIIIEMFFYTRERSKKKTGMIIVPNIENRLYPAMVGAPLMMASLFWIANTAKPTVNYVVPIVGVGVYVWGSMSVIVGVVAYLFNAYPAKGTLSALTAAACFRYAMAGIVPLIVIQSLTKATPKWALSAFGFVVLVLLPVPFVLFFFGRGMRERSRYGGATMAAPAQMNSPESGGQMMVEQ